MGVKRTPSVLRVADVSTSLAPAARYRRRAHFCRAHLPLAARPARRRCRTCRPARGEALDGAPPARGRAHRVCRGPERAGGLAAIGALLRIDGEDLGPRLSTYATPLRKALLLSIGRSAEARAQAGEYYGELVHRCRDPDVLEAEVRRAFDALGEDADRAAAERSGGARAATAAARRRRRAAPRHRWRRSYSSGPPPAHRPRAHRHLPARRHRPRSPVEAPHHTSQVRFAATDALYALLSGRAAASRFLQSIHISLFAGAVTRSSERRTTAPPPTAASSPSPASSRRGAEFILREDNLPQDRGGSGGGDERRVRPLRREPKRELEAAAPAPAAAQLVLHVRVDRRLAAPDAAPQPRAHAHGPAPRRRPRAHRAGRLRGALPARLHPLAERHAARPALQAARRGVRHARSDRALARRRLPAPPRGRSAGLATRGAHRGCARGSTARRRSSRSRRSRSPLARRSRSSSSHCSGRRSTCRSPPRSSRRSTRLRRRSRRSRRPSEKRCSTS